MINKCISPFEYVWIAELNVSLALFDLICVLILRISSTEEHQSQHQPQHHNKTHNSICKETQAMKALKWKAHHHSQRHQALIHWLCTTDGDSGNCEHIKSIDSHNMLSSSFYPLFANIVFEYVENSELLLASLRLFNRIFISTIYPIVYLFCYSSFIFFYYIHLFIYLFSHITEHFIYSPKTPIRLERKFKFQISFYSHAMPTPSVRHYSIHSIGLSSSYVRITIKWVF